MTRPKLWVAFDCESTGFPPQGRLIEIAAVAFFPDGTEPFLPFQQFVRPPVPIPDEITELTGLTNDKVQHADSAVEVLSQFRQWLPASATAVAHNLPFDLAILATEHAVFARELSRQAVDSLPIARVLGEFPNHRLTTIARTLGLSAEGSHRALADARLVKQLVLHAFQRGLPAVCPELFSTGGQND